MGNGGFSTLKASLWKKDSPFCRIVNCIRIKVYKAFDIGMGNGFACKVNLSFSVQTAHMNRVISTAGSGELHQGALVLKHA